MIESESHSFVIRLWLEESAWETDRPTWRGHITHLPSKTPQYIASLDAIATFISPYLEAMGIVVANSKRGPPQTDQIRAFFASDDTVRPLAIPNANIEAVHTQGDLLMIQWTWKFESTSSSADQTKLTLDKNTLLVEAIDRVWVVVPPRNSTLIPFLSQDTECIEYFSMQVAKETTTTGATGAQSAQTSYGNQANARVLYAIYTGNTFDWKGATWYSLENPILVIGRGLIESLRTNNGLPLKIVIANEKDTAVKVAIDVARRVQSDCKCGEQPPKNVTEFDPCPCHDPCPPTTKTECKPTGTTGGAGATGGYVPTGGTDTPCPTGPGQTYGSGQ